MAPHSDKDFRFIGLVFGCLPLLACSAAGSPGTAAAQALSASAPSAVACPPLVQGGAAPPSILSDEAATQLRELLKPYRPDALDARRARALKQALCDAGLWQQPAGRRAVAAAGFDIKQLDRLAPDRGADDASAPVPDPRASDRKVPRPE